MIVLRKPLITEKTVGLAKTGWYTFLVKREFRKAEIKKAIETAFKVNVVGIKTANIKPQVKLQRSRKGIFTTPAFKKAIVSLKVGQKLEIFEGTTEKETAVVTTAKSEAVTEIKEKKNFLRGTKVKIEKEAKVAAEKESKSMTKRKTATAKSQKEEKK